MRASLGFTLIELLVTVAVTAVLLAIAIPSYRYSITANRLSTLANDYVAAINEARMEAIRRNTSVQVCGASGNGAGDLATACGSSQSGAVYSLPSNADDDPLQIRAAPPPPPGVQIATFNAMRYDAQGLGRTPGSTDLFSGLITDLYSDQIDSNSHRCIYMTTGTSLKTCSSDMACDASSEPTACN